MDITPVIVSAISLLTAIIIYILFPWIRSKIGSEQWDNICQWAYAGVQAAEVLYKASGSGVAKRDYVMKFIQEKCEKYGIKYDEKSARIALENAWKEMTEKQDN